MPSISYALGACSTGIVYDTDAAVAKIAREFAAASDGIWVRRGTDIEDTGGDILVWLPKAAFIEFAFDGSDPTGLCPERALDAER